MVNRKISKLNDKICLVTFSILNSDRENLERYCQISGKNKSEVIRYLISSLDEKTARKTELQKEIKELELTINLKKINLIDLEAADQRKQQAILTKEEQIVKQASDLISSLESERKISKLQRAITFRASVINVSREEIITELKKQADAKGVYYRE